MDRKRGSRSRSPQPKRQKVAHDSTPHSPPTAQATGAKKAKGDLCAENLATGLLTEENIQRLRKEYANNEPYKYARVETLFQDDLLKKVKEECLTHLSFTEKETDIYRVSGAFCSCLIYDPASLFGIFTFCGCVFSASRPGRRRGRSIFALLPPFFFSRADPHSEFYTRNFPLIESRSAGFSPFAFIFLLTPIYHRPHHRSTKPVISLPSTILPRNNSLFFRASLPSATPCTLRDSVASYGRLQDVVLYLAQSRICL